MKKILYLFIVCLSFIAFPSCDDRDEIRNDINDLNSRLDALDAQIDAYNKQIVAYQDMVLGQVYIKDYSRDEKTGNYVLTLSDGTAVTVTAEIRITKCRKCILQMMARGITRRTVRTMS